MRLRELERENRELRRTNAILQDASMFFATGLDGRTKRECDTSLREGIDWGVEPIYKALQCAPAT